MFAIYSKELRSLFLSPLAWSLMIAMQLVLGWLFLVQVEQYLELQPKLAALDNAPGVSVLVIAPLLDSAGVVIMMLVPLLTMGIFTRESGRGTLDLLFSSPVSITAIVMGKYLAVLTLLAAVLLLVALLPLSLLLGTRPDIGTLAAGLLAIALASAAYAAVGIWTSSLTQQPAVAALSSYTLLLLLWIINLTGGGDANSPLQQLSLSSHFQRMLSGLVTSGDIAYFLLLILTGLVLCVYRLERLRREG